MDELQFLRIYDFSGGLNDWGSSYALADNEAQESLNCRLDEQGMLQKREGTGTGTTISADYTCFGAGRCYHDPGTTTNVTTKYTICKIQTADGAVLKYGATNPTTTVTLSQLAIYTNDYDLDTTSRMRVVPWGNDRTYITLGANHAMRLGGNFDLANKSNFDDANGLRCPHLMGCRTVADTLVAEKGGTNVGGQTDCYLRFGVSCVYGPDGAWGESVVRESNAYHHDDVDKYYQLNTIQDTSAFDKNFGVRYKRVYATEKQDTLAAAEVAPLYFLKDYDPSSTTAHNFSDTTFNDLDVTRPAPTSTDTGDLLHGTAGAGSENHAQVEYMCAHNARMYLVYQSAVAEDVSGETSETYSDKVYYSNLNLPDEYPAQNWFEVGDKITGLWSAPYGLVIFTKNKIFIWRGYGPGDFQLDEVQGVQGCVAPDSIAQIKMRGKQVIAYAGEDGIYGFDGHTSEYLGITADGTGMKVGGTWKNYATSKSDAQGIAYKDYYLLAYQDSRDSGSYNNRVLAYDMRYDCWWLWDGVDVAAWVHWFGDADSDELYYMSSTDGKQYQFMTGVDNCQWLWTSRDVPLAGPEISVQAKKCYVEMEEDSLPINVTVQMDGVAKSDVFTLESSPTGTWDNVTWGGFTWGRTGTETRSVDKILEDSLIGRRCAVKFEQTDAENKKIVGVSVGYYIRGRA